MTHGKSKVKSDLFEKKEKRKSMKERKVKRLDYFLLLKKVSLVFVDFSSIYYITFF